MDRCSCLRPLTGWFHANPFPYRPLDQRVASAKEAALDISEHTPIEATRKLAKNYRLANKGESLTDVIRRICCLSPLSFTFHDTPLPSSFELTAETGTLAERTHFIASMQGRRNAMEDYHLAQEVTLKENVKAQVYAVFDGHDGESASLFLKDNFTFRFAARYLEFSRKSHSITDEKERQNYIMENALRFTFVSLQEEWQKKDKNGGSTAIVAVILQGVLWVANLGDSRAVLCNHEQTIGLSKDQKPEDPRQEKRINKLGGKVLRDQDTPRINGNLSPGGAFGNKTILGVPLKADVISYELENIAPQNVLILACDGLWDVVSSAEAAAFARAKEYDPDFAGSLVRHAFHKGSGDNITVLTLKIYQNGLLR